MTTWIESFAEEKAERTVDLIRETAYKLLELAEASDVLSADLQAEIANALVDVLKRHISEKTVCSWCGDPDCPGVD